MWTLDKAKYYLTKYTYTLQKAITAAFTIGGEAQLWSACFVMLLDISANK